jgi:condensin complex subunit 3
LTIAQREIIVRNGLGDREPSVRVAAGTLIGTWVDVVGESEGKVEDGEENVENGVVALLKMFNLGENTVAEDALLSVFATRVDIFDNIEFGSAFVQILCVYFN